MGNRLISQVFSTDFWTKLFRDTGEKALHAVIGIIFALILLLIARIVLFRIINRAMAVIVTREKSGGNIESASRARTLAGLLRSVSGYVLVFIAGIMVLRALGADPLPLLTTASVLGLAVGFGAQKLVKDVISGFFILLENQYVVGEYVTIGTVSGIVEEIGMRTTRVRDDIGRLTIISNGDISQVTNHSRGAFLTMVDISVAQDADLDKVCAILRKIGADVASERNDVIGPFTCDGVAGMDGTKVTLRLVGRVDPSAQQDIQMDIRRRVREALVENEVAIA